MRWKCSTDELAKRLALLRGLTQGVSGLLELLVIEEADRHNGALGALEKLLQKEPTPLPPTSEEQARRAARSKAHSAVNLAVQQGNLTRGACEACGEPAQHAHHDDYSKPLDVRMLCAKCHSAIHLKGKRRKKAKSNVIH